MELSLTGINENALQSKYEGGFSVKAYHSRFDLRLTGLNFRKLSLAEVENRQLIPRIRAAKMRMYEDMNIHITAYKEGGIP
jgi:hypothetical protein